MSEAARGFSAYPSLISPNALFFIRVDQSVRQLVGAVVIEKMSYKMRRMSSAATPALQLEQTEQKEARLPWAHRTRLRALLLSLLTANVSNNSGNLLFGCGRDAG